MNNKCFTYIGDCPIDFQIPNIDELKQILESLIEKKLYTKETAKIILNEWDRYTEENKKLHCYNFFKAYAEDVWPIPSQGTKFNNTSKGNINFNLPSRFNKTNKE